MAGLLLALGGCGGDDDADEAPRASTIKAQQIERYTADLDEVQAERLFRSWEDGPAPEVWVGAWRIVLNRTLGILDVRAPDGGGLSFDVVEQRGADVVVTDRDCPETVLRARRTAGSLVFTRVRGRCDSAALLVEEPWRRATDG